MKKPPATRRLGQAAGAIIAALIVSGTVVGHPQSERRVVMNFTPWPSPRLEDRSTAVAPTVAPTPIPTATPVPRPSVRPEVITEAQTVPPTPKPTKRPERRLPVNPRPGTGIMGQATWYDYVPGGAAAGPRLRAALGKDWRYTKVTVCANRSCVRVTLSDWCLCTRGDRVIDLDVGSFARLAPTSAGIVRVTVSW